MVKFEKLWGKLIFALWEDEGSYLLTSYQFAKFKDQINIGSGYWVISVNGMCDQMLLFIKMKPNLKYIVMIKQKATISTTFL